MAIIEISNLKKSFGNLEVLKQITFEVNKNDERMVMKRMD